MDTNHFSRLLGKVAWRLKMVALARSTYWVLLTLAGAFALYLVLPRMLSLLPEQWVGWQMLLILPIIALAGALLFTPRPRHRESARVVDAKMRTKDLFLTVAMIEQAPGAYKPLVVRDAEAKAVAVVPSSVVPFEPWSRSTHVLLTMGVLLVAVLWMPRYDPFGLNTQRRPHSCRSPQKWPALVDPVTASNSNRLARAVMKVDSP